jgi:hypothetical protein
LAEKNNVATNGNNLEPEFDALLKAHVQRQMNVAVCQQFDPDTASAYLEQMLSRTAHLAYEEHLSRCTSCRRHIVELSRLMPPIAASPMMVQADSAHKSKWREWFSGWRLGALAGVSVATIALLFITVTMNQRADHATSLVAANRPELSATLPPSSLSSEQEQRLDKQSHKEFSTTSADAVVPSATPAPKLAKTESVVAAPPAPSSVVSGATALPPPPAPPAPVKEEAAAKDTTLNSRAIAESPQTQRNIQPLLPGGPAQNQMQAERALELKRREQQGQQSAASNAPAPAKSAARSDEFAEERLAEKSKVTDEADNKSARAKPALRPAATMMGRAQRPTRNINAKTFAQENGVWIDTAYESNRNLPVVRLTHDSDEYKQTLKDRPALKPFFDLKPVVVVWQGKVYRVENK